MTGCLTWLYYERILRSAAYSGRIVHVASSPPWNDDGDLSSCGSPGLALVGGFVVTPTEGYGNEHLATRQTAFEVRGARGVPVLRGAN